MHWLDSRAAGVTPKNILCPVYLLLLYGLTTSIATIQTPTTSKTNPIELRYFGLSSNSNISIFVSNYPSTNVSKKSFTTKNDDSRQNRILTHSKCYLSQNLLPKLQAPKQKPRVAAKNDNMIVHAPPIPQQGAENLLYDHHRLFLGRIDEPLNHHPSCTHTFYLNDSTIAQKLCLGQFRILAQLLHNQLVRKS